MGGFEKNRTWSIEKKNEAAIKAMDLKEKTEEFEKKKGEMEEGISRIPTDLPEELQQQVEQAIENARSEMSTEASELANEAKEAQDDADEAIEMMRNVADDYQGKAGEMKSLQEIPLIGCFAETKGEELDDKAGQMIDLARETQQYSDSLAESRNRLLSR